MKISRANDVGVRLASEAPNENIQALIAYPEYGSVIFRVDLGARYKDVISEPIQYLTPEEAMALANGLERCAIAALKEGA